MDQSLIYYMFLIFTGASVMATIALATRQSLLVAYILMGVIIGPWGLGWITDPKLIMHLSDVGIVFLLFLLGLSLDPKSLIHLLKNSIQVTLISCFLFGIVGFGLARVFHFTWIESAVIGTTMMFSSTIIGLKLLPTTVLHHQRMGEVMISVLLLQDIIAITAMIVIEGYVGEASVAQKLMTLGLGVPGLLLFCVLFERYVLSALFRRFDRIQEYIFLLAIGWSLGVAVIAQKIGLSYEIGAFMAGVVIAVSPISLFIAESLKPLRDFFLVMFFFALGAALNLDRLGEVIWPALLLAGLMLLMKPYVFSKLLKSTASMPHRTWEIGVRLGQISEFSLLVAYIAFNGKVIGETAYFLIQASTLVTFVVSSYWVVMRYPTPLGFSENLRRD
ncbi:MAG: cation:proton antiporter [Gammaproteobacteria bacterium]